MQPLIKHTGIIIPLNRANMDTDMLLPKQYLKSLDSHGFGNFLFDDERYLDPGEIDTPISSRRENPDFILNQEPYRHGSVVLAQANFGCGSSREHAVWALRDFGVRIIIAPSFGDIFTNNCFNNGLLPLTLPQADIDQLFVLAQGETGLQANLDLTNKTLRVGVHNWTFELEEGRRQRLINGLDEVGETLQYAEQIRNYEAARQRQEPWIFHP